MNHRKSALVRTDTKLIIAFVLALFAASFTASAQPAAPTTQPASIPGVEKQDLFVARTDGYTVYRIPGILATSRGTILAWCEARKEKGLDWDPIDVLLRRSADGGRTWDAPRPIAIAPPDAAYNPAEISHHLGGKGVTLNNPVMIAGPGDVVHFLYCVNYGRLFYRRSDDDGKTFSAPVEITSAVEPLRSEYDWKVIGTGPGHGIRLSRGAHAGRLIVPAWFSLGTGNNGHNPNLVASVYSDDDGKTWHVSHIAVPDTAETPSVNETEAVELSDGRVMFNSRVNSPRHRRLITLSPDGVTDWSRPIFDEALFEPVCFGSLIRVPLASEQKGIAPIVFCNPDSSASNWKGMMRPRRNLTLRKSVDDGKTWPESMVLEPGTAGYNDLAALPDGTLLCLYERGGIHDMFDTGYLTLARVRPDSISAAVQPAAR